ncbi:MAG: hypothetical protein II046_00720 [Clostridiales bacterium]|nr:hypothetical protein [Clostridiales bacterium]
MGAFRDNDKDWNRDPNNMRSGSTGSDNSAPDNDNAGTAKGNGGKGFEYPGLSNPKTGSGTPDISGDGSGASDNFEYGDDSVAGEYDVRESPVFNYGGGSIPETIGAYYGSETRQDRYARDSFNEGYGYETVPEVDYSEVVNEQLSAEFGQDSASSEPQHPESVSAQQEDPGAQQAEGYEPEYPGSYGHHESQADELDSLRAYGSEAHRYDTDDDPNIAANGMPFIDEDDAERLSALPAGHGPNRIAGSIIVSAIALAGIIGIFVFALFCDRRKTNDNNAAGYVAPTTKEEVTTTAEATPTATATPTPVPTATPTPEPTATPVPTNTPTPKPQQIYWPVAKKTTPTPTPTPTVEGGTGEGGSTGEGSGEGSGTSEGGSGEGSGGSTEGGGGSEGSGGEGSGTGEGGSGSGSGEGSGTTEGGSTGGEGGSGSGTTPDVGGSGSDTNTEPQAEANP